MTHADHFHDYVFIVLLLITSLLLLINLDVLSLTVPLPSLTDHSFLEIWWTLVPALVLVLIVLPSLHLLYLMDEVDAPSLSLSSVGHQWYWEYSYPDFTSVSFDSYMAPEALSASLRALDVDNRVLVPVNTLTRLLLTSSDVLHSWAMPSLGVKVDATPGRLSQIPLSSSFAGLSYGQCSEICGANHSFMPIVLEFTILSPFLSWLSSWS